MTDFQIPVLSRGAHMEGSGRGCLMEQLSWIQGEAWSDAPECVHPLLAVRLRWLNDRAPRDGSGDRRDPKSTTPIGPEWSVRLIALAAKAVGTRHGNVTMVDAAETTWPDWEMSFAAVEALIDRVRAELGLGDPTVTVDDFARATEAITT